MEIANPGRFIYLVYLIIGLGVYFLLRWAGLGHVMADKLFGFLEKWFVVLVIVMMISITFIYS